METESTLTPEGNVKKPTWYELNKEKAKAASKAWREANPERYKELRNNWARQKTIQDSRGKRLKMWRERGAIYKAPSPDYDEQLRNQGGKCAICEALPTPKRLFIEDREHLTGRFRGLLCKKCSIGISYFKTIKIVEYALKYMKREGVAERPSPLAVNQAP